MKIADMTRAQLAEVLSRLIDKAAASVNVWTMPNVAKTDDERHRDKRDLVCELVTARAVLAAYEKTAGSEEGEAMPYVHFDHCEECGECVIVGRPPVPPGPPRPPRATCDGEKLYLTGYGLRVLCNGCRDCIPCPACRPACRPAAKEKAP